LEILGNIKYEGDIYPEYDITFDIGRYERKVRNGRKGRKEERKTGRKR
jgi:hypothetical protein